MSDAPGAGKRKGVRDLESIDMVSGVNEQGEGFVHVFARADGDVVAMGQLTPKQMRDHGMDAIQAAEAAEQDAAVLRTLRRLELPDDLAAHVVAELRATRED